MQPYQKWFNPKTVILLTIVIILSVLVTRFFEKLHYDNLLLQDGQQISNQQAELVHRQADLKYLIDNTNSQLNCYNFSSSYARSLCGQHNQRYPQP